MEVRDPSPFWFFEIFFTVLRLLSPVGRSFAFRSVLRNKESKPWFGYGMGLLVKLTFVFYGRHRFVGANRVGRILLSTFQFYFFKNDGFI
jgi:hypothetical protein